jgi:tetratricopeptide (TPR) repeat protein
VALGGLLVQTARPRDAAPLLDRALALDPRNATVRLERAAEALGSGQEEAAASDLEEARRIDDRLPYLHVLEARLLTRRGRLDPALEELRRAEALTDSEAQLGEILALEARVALDLGKTDDARRVLAQARGIAPERLLRVAEGDLAKAQGDFARAVGFYKDAVAEGRPDAVLERKLGESLAALGSKTEAEAAFRRALAGTEAPSDLEGVYGDLSLLLQSEGREGEVRHTLEAGVKVLPRSAALWGMEGAALGRAADYRGAIAAFERSVAIQPTPLACKSLAALVFEEQKDRPRAVALWKQSLALDPGQRDVQLFLDRYGR